MTDQSFPRGENKRLDELLPMDESAIETAVEGMGLEAKNGICAAIRYRASLALDQAIFSQPENQDKLKEEEPFVVRSLDVNEDLLVKELGGEDITNKMIFIRELCKK